MLSEQVEYSLNEQGQFIINDYNWAAPFSSFLPGIAGKWGIPMWSFYINRNQAISSMGVQDKDHALMGFRSFNEACLTVSTLGFRTFLKSDEFGIREPFLKKEDPAIRQRMIISSHELEIEEIDDNLGIQVNVVYFNLVNERLPGLFRWVRIKNLSQESRVLEILDGLPKIVPYGVSFEHLKVIPRHIEGMMGVQFAGVVPIFSLKQTAADIEEIGSLSGGNFFYPVSIDPEQNHPNVIVDPTILFGDSLQLDFPWSYQREDLAVLLSREQVLENRTPSAMGLCRREIKAGACINLVSLYGYSPDLDSIESIRIKIQDKGYLTRKRDENQNLVERIKSVGLTWSSDKAFDHYCQQTYLDNVLRGGTPTRFGSGENRKVFYIFGRQGGDLERDYHWFHLDPTYLSQGTAHYRNMLQNRRMDNWFYPEIGDHNIHLFMNLIQLDGYNPLVINPVLYNPPDQNDLDSLIPGVTDDPESEQVIRRTLSRDFTPGEVILKLDRISGNLLVSREQFLGELLPLCSPVNVGGLHEGYWIDHWFYNLDLIESYLAIHPDGIDDLFLGDLKYTFFDNPDVVQPWEKKLKVRDGNIRQYQAVRRDQEKTDLIASRERDPNLVRVDYGRGSVYRTNLLVKLISVLANKIATLDPFGVGIEMEAGKPGWCDSLNGLPGLFGSSVCETLELIRLCRILLNVLNKIQYSQAAPIYIYQELQDLIGLVSDQIGKYQKDNTSDRSLDFWRATHSARERYLNQTRLGINGNEATVKLEEIKEFVGSCQTFLESIFEESKIVELSKGGVPYTYFINKITGTESGISGAHKFDLDSMKPGQITQVPVSLFLEGPTHYVRVYPERAKQVYHDVCESDLYDRQLNTFKVCESLSDQSFELGRIKAYPSGWIENESVYTHMQYKWLLELLRAGLYEEFFKEIKSAFPPFLDPRKYGRSILENCSFIASSAHPDQEIHGRGFQPRFCGVTAEFINIWLLMSIGREPFRINQDKELEFHLVPILADWLFNETEDLIHSPDASQEGENLNIPKDCYAVNILEKTLLIYHNPARLPTYGKSGATIDHITLHARSGETHRVEGKVVPEPFSSEIRDKKIKRIEVELV